MRHPPSPEKAFRVPHYYLHTVAHQGNRTDRYMMTLRSPTRDPAQKVESTRSPTASRPADGLLLRAESDARFDPRQTSSPHDTTSNDRHASPLATSTPSDVRAASERLAELIARSTLGATTASSRPIRVTEPSTPAPAEPAPSVEVVADNPQPAAHVSRPAPKIGPTVPTAVAGLSLTEMRPAPSSPPPPAAAGGSRKPPVKGGAYNSATRQMMAMPLAGPVTLGRFLAGFAVMVVLLGVGFLIAGPGEPSTATAATPTRSHTFQGVAMPVSDEAGPAQFDDATASGFAHTDAGAAMAGLHLTVRSDARTGPTVFEPLLQQQVTGDPGAIKAMVDNRRAEYKKWAQFKGVTDNGPVILPGAFSFVGWKIADWSTSGPVTVHLLVEDPKTLTLYDVAPVLEWDATANDYKLVATPNFGYPKQATVQPSDRSTYTLFATQ